MALSSLFFSFPFSQTFSLKRRGVVVVIFLLSISVSLCVLTVCCNGFVGRLKLLWSPLYTQGFLLVCTSLDTSLCRASLDWQHLDSRKVWREVIVPQFQCRLRVIWGGNPAFTVNQHNYLVAVKGSGKGSHFFLVMGTYRFSTSPKIFLNSRGHFTCQVWE